MKGNLIGVNYAVSGGSYFAIPVNEFKSLIDTATLTPFSELYKLYKADVPAVSEIKNVNRYTQTINFQPFFYLKSREILLNINQIYTGDEAKAIVHSESTLNRPGFGSTWIVRNINDYNDQGGIISCRMKYCWIITSCRTVRHSLYLRLLLLREKDQDIILQMFLWFQVSQIHFGLVF